MYVCMLIALVPVGITSAFATAIGTFYEKSFFEA